MFDAPAVMLLDLILLVFSQMSRQLARCCRDCS